MTDVLIYSQAEVDRLLALAKLEGKRNAHKRPRDTAQVQNPPREDIGNLCEPQQVQSNTQLLPVPRGVGLVGVPYDVKKEYAQHSIVTKKGQLYKLHFSKRRRYNFSPLCTGCAADGRVTIVRTKNAVCKECKGESKNVPWKRRYEEFRDEHCPKAGVRLITTQEEWEKECSNGSYKPKLECLTHPGVDITGPKVSSVASRRTRGCPSCNLSSNLWWPTP